MNYPLASTTWDEKEYEALQSIIASGNFTMGKKVEEFEKNFAKFFGSKYAVMVNSGSSANLLAIAALFYRNENKLEIGDEVIVPAVSWATTYHPLQQYGLKCKFVDIDIETLNYDLDALKNAVSDKTRLIVAVNLLGNSNDFDIINEIIGDKNIILFEDNCESLGAKFNGKFAGTIGLMGTFSSFFSHHISTMEGGLVVTDDEELYHIMLSLRSHGWTRHLPKENLVTGLKSDDEFEESFKFVLPGFNLRPGELHGALGIEQLKKVEDLIIARRKNAKIFVEEFKNFDFLYIQKEIHESSWFGFSIILKENSPFTRAQLVNAFREKDIECRPIVSGNFLKNPVMKYYDYSVSSEIKNADLLDSNGLFIGNHHFNLENEIKLAASVIEKLIG